MRVRGLLAAAVLAGGLVAAIASPVRAENQSEEVALRWLAIGDSYSSGEGVDGASGECQRSPDAYAPAARLLVDASSEFVVREFVFAACTGAVIDDVPGQLARWTADQPPNLVTLTMGGNDIPFSGVLKDCIGLNDLGTLDVLIDLNLGLIANPVNDVFLGLGDVIDPRGCDVSEAELERRVDAVADAMSIVYATLSALVGEDGHVVVLGYPKLFGTPGNLAIGDFGDWAPWHGERCSGVTRQDASMLERIADRLTAQLAAATRVRDNVHFVEVLSVFRGRSACSIDNWINEFPTIGAMTDWEGEMVALPRINRSFHPNGSGHAALGAHLAEVVQELDWPNSDESAPAGDLPDAIPPIFVDDQLSAVLSDVRLPVIESYVVDCEPDAYACSETLTIRDDSTNESWLRAAVVALPVNARDHGGSIASFEGDLEIHMISSDYRCASYYDSRCEVAARTGAASNTGAIASGQGWIYVDQREVHCVIVGTAFGPDNQRHELVSIVVDDYYLDRREDGSGYLERRFCTDSRYTPDTHEVAFVPDFREYSWFIGPSEGGPTTPATPPEPPGAGSPAPDATDPEPDPLNVPSPPVAVQGEPGDGVVAVSWSTNFDGGSPIISYQIESDRGGVRSASSKTLLWTGLSNGTAYRFRVRAENAGGWSVWSTWSPSVTPAATSTLIDLTGDGAADCADLQLITDAFLYSQPLPLADLDGDDLIGTGEVGTWIQRFTNAGFDCSVGSVPNPPVEVDGAPGDGQVAVWWSDSDDGGSPITGYEVEGYEEGVRSASGPPFVWTGLPNGLSFQFRVRAQNANGWSDWSTWSAWVVPLAPLQSTMTPESCPAGVCFGSNPFIQTIWPLTPGGTLSVFAAAPDSRDLNSIPGYSYATLVDVGLGDTYSMHWQFGEFSLIGTYTITVTDDASGRSITDTLAVTSP